MGNTAFVGGIVAGAAVLSAGIVAGAVAGAAVMSSAIKPGVDGVAKMADAFVESKPAVNAAGQGIGALGRSASTLTALLTEPWPARLLPWRR